MLFSRVLQRVFSRSVNPPTLTAECGHPTALQGIVIFNSRSTPINWQPCLDQGQHPKYCLPCLQRLATTCDMCRTLIMPETPVQRSESGCIVCLDCAPLGPADATGKWSTAGYQSRW